jgi:hypothetical protein
MRNVLFFLAIAVGILVQLSQSLTLVGRPRVEPPRPALLAPAPGSAEISRAAKAGPPEPKNEEPSREEAGR